MSAILTGRQARGGAWGVHPKYALAATRSHVYALRRLSLIGLRLLKRVT